MRKSDAKKTSSKFMSGTAESVMQCLLEVFSASSGIDRIHLGVQKKPEMSLH